MKRVLLVHHTLQPPGGGSAVAAWVMQALRGSNEVVVLTWTPVEIDSVNRAFGTSLRTHEFHWRTVKPALRRSLDLMPVRLALLTSNALFRAARTLLAKEHFDIVISTANEIDVGVRAIQYIHYPWAKFPRPDADYRWYHFSAPLRLYRWLSARVSGYSEARVRRNVTLVNSDWTGRIFSTYYGTPATKTVYPPVPGGFPSVPFADRDDAFACIGRLSGEKEVDKMIDILSGVRARGHPIAFRVVGPIDRRGYAKRIFEIAEPHRSWISFHHDLPRTEMLALLARCRYGIHGMVGEHFGIGVAELQRAGCITFVPHDGGPVEIVGRDERVIYGSADDAVEKIDRVLSDAAYRQGLLRDVTLRKDRFSEHRFMAEIREVVKGFS